MILKAPSVAGLLLLILLLFCGQAAAQVHLDKRNLPLSCVTCHYKSNLKSGGGPAVCITCHGDPQRLSSPQKNMPKGFAPAGMRLKNIEAEFAKIYRHPTFDSAGRHRGNEVLPETDPKMPRHAECADCHHPHMVGKNSKYAGIRRRASGTQTIDILHEYELCYRCHAESANLPGRYANKRAEFSTTNPSFHPVEGEGRNLAVVSLIRPYREKKTAQEDISTFSCNACHGSDDANGPKGPHGSRYEHILIDNYYTKDKQPESPFAYALCYRCHNRSSILANESFRYHSLHILGTGRLSAGGTSCSTCHSAHGSQEYRYLIKFNPEVVTLNSKGLLKFVEKGSYKFSGECYLSCHGVDHNPKSY